MTNKILYVDGDSHTTPSYVVEVKDSYWKLFGDALGFDNIVNYAYSNKSNEGIFRSATRFILENPDSDITLLLGLTHLERYDEFIREKELAAQAGRVYEKDAPNPNPAEVGVGSKTYSNEDKEDGLVHFWHREFDEAKFLSNLIAFSAFCQTKQVKFILHFCEHPLVPSDINLLRAFYNEIKTIPNAVNFFENTYITYNQQLNIKPADFIALGWLGHHGAAGNKVYAEFLINKYREIYEQ